MGIYHDKYPNPCPRCGGIVGTTFISVSPMSFYVGCHGCGTTEFTSEELAALAAPTGNGEPATPEVCPTCGSIWRYLNGAKHDTPTDYRTCPDAFHSGEPKETHETY